MNPRWVHTASGAGLLGYAEQREMCNLVRPGLMLYGVNPFTAKTRPYRLPASAP